MLYQETECTIHHNGQAYTSRGACVTPDYAVCYPDETGHVKDWHGNILGTYRVVAKRRALFFGHRSWQGDTWYTMHAYIDGVRYSLRGFGPGMIARGKALKC